MLLGIGGLALFTHQYVKYARLIEEKFRGGPFTSTSKIFAAPLSVGVGDRIGVGEIVARLRGSGYGEARGNRMGWYHLRPNAIEIFPGPDSYFAQEAGVIKFSEDRISGIVSLQDNTDRPIYQLEPELITNLSDRNRQKRRLVRFADIPKVLIEAVTSAEDKRFFHHAGFDPIRIIKAAFVDIRERRNAMGASTLSMQLAREFFLSPERGWKRKIPEALITLQLEQKLSKEQIFECYANQIPLGRRGTFDIHGFGEGAQAFFGKDFRQLNLPEAATIAGLIQGPSLFNPYRHPDRMKKRRNVVLLMMRQNGYISEKEYAQSIEAPLTIAAGAMESSEAPYFVDLVNDELQNRLQDHDFQTSSYRVYTTLDLNLQHAASEAVQMGMKSVDEQLKRQRRHRNKTFTEAQCALVALDAKTGEIKALIGGRNYGVSQLNRVLAKRQPGSIFKPFVYAAALNTAVTGASKVLTPISTVLDERTTFWFDNKPYEPGNFQDKYYGPVTYRQALAKSMNIPTVKIAEMVGYDVVVDLAKSAGMNLDIRPTPSVALGAYEVMPIEMAGAYTVFANQGVYTKPSWISLVRAQDGKKIFENKLESRPVLDPRVTYLMVELMQEVMRSGTAVAVRGRGFSPPAAAKTGTSHDGWFAGFTSELLCIVWVGFDDNRDLKLEGAHSALPIWTEFMKRALEYREYRNVRQFRAPDGIVSVQIDPLSGKLATAACPGARAEVFIGGTQPLESCPLHGGAQQGVTYAAGWETSAAAEESPKLKAPASVARSRAPRSSVSKANAVPPASEPGKPKEKQGFWRRALGVFR